MVTLHWIPLGAGGAVIVRWSGRGYEALVARREKRSPRPLFHAALTVEIDGHRHTIESAPAWGPYAGRGVVASGPVGLAWLGRSRFFRYEVRRWRNGRIPDIAHAVGGPVTLSHDEAHARHLLELVPQVPTPTWGRDELRAGEMWNSNSLVAWLLVRSGHDVSAATPPLLGRAPGWSAGLVVASR